MWLSWLSTSHATAAVLLHRLVLDLLAFRFKLCCVVTFFGLHSTWVDFWWCSFIYYSCNLQGQIGDKWFRGHHHDLRSAVWPPKTLWKYSFWFPYKQRQSNQLKCNISHCDLWKVSDLNEKKFVEGMTFLSF